MRFYLILYIFIIGTYGFGLFDRLFSIITPFGIITDSMLLLGIIMSYDFFFKKRYIVNYLKTDIKFLILFVFLIIVAIAKNLIFDNSGFGVLVHVRRLYMIFYIFPLIYTFKNQTDIEKFVKFIILIAFLTAILFLFQNITQTLISEQFMALYSGGERRGYTITLTLIGFVLILLYSIHLNDVKMFNFSIWIIIIVMVLAILFSFTRSLIMGILISGIFLFIIHIKNNSQRTFRTLIRTPIILVLLILASIYLLNLFNFDFGLLTRRFDLIGADISNRNYGSHSIRYEMITIKMSNILHNYPFFGLGFNYQDFHYLDWNKEDYFAVNTITSDATYPNIAIYFGLTGVILFMFLLIGIYLTAHRLYHASQNRFVKSYSLSMMVFPIYIFILSFYTDTFEVLGLTILTTFLGILTLLNSKRFKQNDKLL